MGAIVNALAIVVCGFMGLQIRTGIPERIHLRLMQAVGLCVLGMGLAGTIQGQETLILIISMVLGTLIGEAIDIDAWVIKGVDRLGKSSSQDSSQSGQLTQGFLSAAMIFCIGSMAIVGSLESGLTGDHTTLYTKSILDGITSFLLASTLGSGVLLSAIPVLLLQGGLTIFASMLQPILPADVIVEIISVGSLLLIGLGLNMLEVTNLKIMNFTPAIFLPILLMLFI